MRGHICRKGENITAGLEASSSRVHNDSTRSSTDVESLDASGRLCSVIRAVDNQGTL